MKKKIILISTIALMTACTKRSTVDAHIENYMAKHGQAKIEEAVRKALIEVSQGKTLATSEMRLKTRVNIPIDHSPVIGRADAKHTMTVFVDYSDPLSGQLLDIANKMVNEEKNNLKLVVKFSPNAQNGLSLPATRALLAADRLGKFTAYHNRVVGNRTQLSQMKLLEWAQELGISSHDFTKLLTDNSLDRSVESDRDLISRHSGTRSPAAFIDGVQLEQNEFNSNDMTEWLKKLRS